VNTKLKSLPDPERNRVGSRIESRNWEC